MGPRRDWCRSGGVRLAGFFTDSVTPSDVMEELLKVFIKMSKGSERFKVFNGSPRMAGYEAKPENKRREELGAQHKGGGLQNCKRKQPGKRTA